MIARLCALALLAGSVCTLAHAQELRLNEFVAANQTGLQDEDGDYSDWIEIWNAGLQSVSLLDWTLTDNAGDPTRWEFPAVDLAPGEYLIVFASEKDRTDPLGVLHTNFRLSSGGEYLALFEPGGQLARTEFAPSYPAQLVDIAYGFEDPGPVSGLAYLDPPSPGAANSGAFQLLEPVDFSRSRGVYPGPVQVALSHPNPSAAIHYTLDGSQPSASHGQVYTGPLLFSDTAILRVAAVASGYVDSLIQTHSFIVSESVRDQSDAGAHAAGFPVQWVEMNGTEWSLGGSRPGAHYEMDSYVIAGWSQNELFETLTAVPSVSLVMEIDEWFGDGQNEAAGIYTHSEYSGPAWVRPVSIEWFDAQSGTSWRSDCGVKIQGGSSTHETKRNQLSMALKFQSQFGPSKLEFNPFGPGAAEEYDTLILEAGNQHSINAQNSTSGRRHAQELRDRFMMDLHGAMGAELVHGRPVHLYLNGLYWGLYRIHERPDDNFAASYLGGEPEEHDWVSKGIIESGNSNSATHPNAPGAWATANAIASAGLAPGAQWDGIPAIDALARYLDLERYADYLLLNYYGGNMDWPHTNWMMTSHARTGAHFALESSDPSFRPHSWDAEFVLFWGGNELVVGGWWDRTNTLEPNDITSAVFLHTHLIAHPDWPVLMADRAFRHLMKPDGALYVEPGFEVAGTPYDPAHPERNRPASLYHASALEIEHAVLLEFARWGDYWFAPGSTNPADWIVERDRLLEDFFPVRSNVLLDQLRNAPGTLYPSIDPVTFTQPSGVLPGGTDLMLAGPTGAQIWYTLDGRDPRESGGGTIPSALQWTGPTPLPEGEFVRVRARAFSGSEWSPIDERSYQVGVDVAINEFVASNATVIADPFGEFDDYVELTNRSRNPVDLSGWFLSDDPENPQRWSFPAGTTIRPRGYLLVWCDDDVGQGGLHTNFRLSSNGEELLLSGPASAGSPLLDQIVFGPQLQDRSMSRLPDRSGPFKEDIEPTPAFSNPIASPDH